MNITFKRATRAQIPLKLGLVGPSGSGKTTAALKLTRGLVGPDAPIALLDTENGSASLYADVTAFDALNMNAPYLTEKFLGAIEAAVQGGYKALIIDSASHEWIQILQDKEALDARGGNSWTNWASFTKKHEEFLTAIRNAPIHLVLCLRAKEKHEMNDAKKVVKLGMGSQMRDGFEYELTTVFDIAMDHSGKTSKDRTCLFDGRIAPVTEATGRELAAWLASGGELVKNTGEAFPVDPANPTKAQAASIAPSAAAQTSSVPATTEATSATPGAFAQMVKEDLEAKQADRPAVSAEAEAFVEGVSPTPGMAGPDGVADILMAAQQGRVNPDQLLAYAQKKGWATTEGWTSLSREGADTLALFLGDPDKLRGLRAHLNQHHPMAA